MPRILGIDYGQKRFGIALSDDDGEFAFPHETIAVRGKKHAMSELERICREENVAQVVIGLPLNMDGSAGPMADEVKEFADWAYKRLDMPIHLWDERLTSAEVEAAMLAADLRRDARRNARDKLAAQRILQSYLDASGQVDQGQSDA